MTERGTYRPDYREIRKDYAFSATDEGECRLLKWVIDNKLTEPERVTIILYAELGNLRALVPYLGVSLTTVHKTVKRVQGKIRTELAKALKEGLQV